MSQRSPRTRLPSLPDVFSDREELADALEEGRGSAQNDLIKARRDQIASLAAYASPPGGSVACLSFASPPPSAAAPDGVLIQRPRRPTDGGLTRLLSRRTGGVSDWDAWNAARWPQSQSFRIRLSQQWTKWGVDTRPS
jgi:hypothetical protein